MITVYGIKNCDSVKKALAFFKKHDIAYTFVDFKTDPVGEAEVDRWLAMGAEMQQLFNTRGTTYRTLKLKELNLDDGGKRTWLAKENLLIKRPVVETGNHVIIGFNEPLYEGELLS
ncbi:Spx/MgsR family RNA polymerase-binding regulatory protein [Sulfurimonas sp. HSL-1656]|uniref:arsenate reductase family protein n=1 Tax=Thiomicrolovo subterrani TaxID=3131934 RepID=UPI0031F8C25A